MRGGRPKGSTGRSDLRLLWAFLKKRSMRFIDLVRTSRLSRATAMSCLKRFVKADLISKSEGRRPIYKLIRQDRAWRYLREKNPKLGAIIEWMIFEKLTSIKNMDWLKFRENEIPELLKGLDARTWIKVSGWKYIRGERWRKIPWLGELMDRIREEVPNGDLYSNYWGFEWQYILFLVYAFCKNSDLLQPSLQNFQTDMILNWLLERLRTWKSMKRKEKERLLGWLKYFVPTLLKG